MGLTNKKCLPCEGGTSPLTPEQTENYLKEASGWEIVEDGKKIKREFVFGDFKETMAFVNRVAELAENEGHHPDFHIFYGKAALELWTHAVGGLSENDLILAAKINQLL